MLIILAAAMAPLVVWSQAPFTSVRVPPTPPLPPEAFTDTKAFCAGLVYVSRIQDMIRFLPGDGLQVSGVSVGGAPNGDLSCRYDGSFTLIPKESDHAQDSHH